jgi:hypothetical protein
MRMRLLVVVSTLAALAFAAGAQATAPRGTLTGIVTRGPVTPVCVAEQPCSEVAPDVALLFVRNGAIVGRTTTNADGHYRLRLPAGTYAVRRAVVTGTLDRKLEPNHARVYGGRSHRVDFSIDTGIR